jgi:acetolactate synthase-1/2/3 large subunit
VIVCGSGAATSDAGQEILQFSQQLTIPIAFSCHAKGLVPDTYELTAGSVGTYSCESANRIVSKADLVIYIGSGTGDQVTMNWTIPSDEVKKIQIDINPSELGRNYAHVHGIWGDARESVRMLIDQTNNIAPKSKWGSDATKIIREWKNKLVERRENNSVPIKPERLCKAISDVLPSDAILVADTGYSAVWACSMIELGNINQTFIRAAGSLGWAFPASLGAKCAAPERPVICFTGDGGFMYHIAELETARRRGIHTVTVINNNNAFGQSMRGIDMAYASKEGRTDGRKEDVYEFSPVNYAKVAEDMGCVGIRVEKPEELNSALERALGMDRPVVVEVMTDGKSNPPIAWTP